MLEISQWKVNAVDNNCLYMLDVLEGKIMVMKEEFYRRQLRKCGAHRKMWLILPVERTTPLLEGSTKMESEIKLEDRDNLSVISTLIFAVPFAAALTVPRGFRSNNGVPVRMYSVAFQCFIVSDTLAFCFSILAMSMLSFQDRDRQKFTIGIL
ncbi:hypothetical protein SUGI_0440710 [Cryptomeria japonica]|nr:hypothetical protein SUGI_0440710 [Cryptomeria japonica]